MKTLPSYELDNLALIHKLGRLNESWDWHELSKNKQNTLQVINKYKCLDKPWDWHELSRNKKKLYKRYININVWINRGIGWV